LCNALTPILRDKNEIAWRIESRGRIDRYRQAAAWRPSMTDV